MFKSKGKSKNKVSSYARKSFRNFVIAFLLLVIQMFSLLVLANGGFSTGTGIIFFIPIAACLILAMLGIVYGVKSVRQKENSKWLKYIGLVGNLMLASTLFSMLMYFLFTFVR